MAKKMCHRKKITKRIINTSIVGHSVAPVSGKFCTHRAQGVVAQIAHRNRAEGGLCGLVELRAADESHKLLDDTHVAQLPHVTA